MELAFTYFGEVAKLGSIRKAAERLYVSASAISRQIAKLEREFDTPLLVRQARGVKLTPAGTILAEFVQGRARELERLKTLISDLNHLKKGHVSLRVVEGMLSGYLPEALATFATRYPGITYEVAVCGTDDVMLAVAENRCDIGISFHPYPRVGVETIAYIRQPLLAVMPPQHRLAKRLTLRLIDLVGESIGLPDKNFGIRHLIDHAIKASAVELQIRLETNSITMVREFAVQGMGITFLPAFAFEREAAAGTLVGIPLADPALSTASTHICKRAGLALTPPASMLLDTLINATQATQALHLRQRTVP